VVLFTGLSLSFSKKTVLFLLCVPRNEYLFPIAFLFLIKISSAHKVSFLFFEDQLPRISYKLHYLSSSGCNHIISILIPFSFTSAACNNRKRDIGKIVKLYV